MVMIVKNESDTKVRISAEEIPEKSPLL